MCRDNAARGLNDDIPTYTFFMRHETKGFGKSQEKRQK